MVRVKQFADDLAISTKQAKDLINKGRNRRDGGSQILEKTMSDTEKKKKKKKTAKKKDIMSGRTKKDYGIPPSPMPPFIEGGRSRRDYDEPDVPPMAPMTPFRDYGDPRLMSDGGSNVTKVNTDKLTKAQMGQFKNIVNASTSGKITPAEAQKKIRKMLTMNKRVGGATSLSQYSPLKPRGKSNTAGIDGPSGEKRKPKAVKRPVRVANVDDFKEAPKLDKQKAGAKKMLKTVKKAVKRKDGGGFPDLTGDGKVTKKDILKGRGVPGFSRGGGIAIQGLGFKGVR